MRIASLGRRIALNTVTNLTGYASTVVVAFFITPYVIRSVGAANYGLWLVLLAFVGYAAMLEFGLQESLAKLVSRYEPAGEEGKIREIFSISWAFVLLVSLLAAALLVAGAPRALPLFLSEPEQIRIARSLLLFVALDVVLILNKFAFAGMIYGFQLYYVKNLIDTVLNLLNPLLVFLLLRRGYDIHSLPLASIAVNAAAIVLYLVVLRRHSRGLRFTLRGIRWSTAREIFTVGSKIFTNATITRAGRNAQPLVIAWFLPSAYNTFFSIPHRLVQYGTEMLYVLSTGYMPIFSELSARGDTEGIRELYFRYTRYILILFYPLIVGLVSFGHPFIALWMGPEYAEHGKYVILLLSLALLLASTQPLLHRMLVGIGRLNVLVAVTAVSTVVQFVGSIFMVRAFGITGMALTIFAVALATQIFWWTYAADHLGIRLTAYLTKGQGRILPCLAVYFAVAESLKHLHPPAGYLDILWQMLAGGLVYFPLVYAFVLRDDERSSIQRSLLRAVAAKEGG